MKLDLPYFFAVKTERTVRADHTIRWMGKTLSIQRKRGERCLAGERVMVHVTPEGDSYLYRGKVRLAYTIHAIHTIAHANSPVPGPLRFAYGERNWPL